MKPEIFEDLLSTVVETKTPPAALKQNILSQIDAPVPVQRAFLRFGWDYALAAAFLFGIWSPSFLQKATVIGRATEVQGNVRIDGRSVSNGDSLRSGQTLSTADGASTELRLGDRILIKVKENSELAMKALGNGYQIDLQRGAAISLVKPGTPYAVLTPALKAEAVGTGFFMKVLGPQKTYVCICVGHIVISRGRFQGDMKADHHKALIAVKRGDGLETEPGAMIDHSDEEIGRLLDHFQ